MYIYVADYLYKWVVHTSQDNFFFWLLNMEIMKTALLWCYRYTILLQFGDQQADSTKRG